MRIRHIEKGLPRKWSRLAGANKALGIWDIRVTPRSRLHMKLLLFKDSKDFRHFVDKALGHKMCRLTRGVVVTLRHERQYLRGPLKGQTFNMVDPRYFAVMCLIQGHLNMEVIAHESAHAAFAYEWRVGKAHKWPGADKNSDEHVCYPLGRIAQFVYDALDDAGFLKKTP